jgi:hypothetical protein
VQPDADPMTGRGRVLPDTDAMAAHRLVSTLNRL